MTAVLRPVVPPATALDTEPPVPGGTTNLLAETAVPEGTLAGLLEPAQPVYARYWLHGKGPAPAGNLPVAVHVSPQLSGLRPGTGAGAGRQGRPARGRHPAVGTLRPAVPSRPLRRRLPAARCPRELLRRHRAGGAGDRGRDRQRGRLRPARPRLRGLGCRGPGPARHAPGRYIVAAQISDDLGQVIEDAAVVHAGGPDEPDLYLPLDEVLPLIEADAAATAAELGLAVLTPALRLAPGGTARADRRAGQRHWRRELRGEAQLVSPFGSWEALGPVDAGLPDQPGGRATRAASAVRDPRRGPARHPVVGAGQDHVLRPGPLQPRPCR